MGLSMTKKQILFSLFIVTLIYFLFPQKNVARKSLSTFFNKEKSYAELKSEEIKKSPKDEVHLYQSSIKKESFDQKRNLYKKSLFENNVETAGSDLDPGKPEQQDEQDEQQSKFYTGNFLEDQALETDEPQPELNANKRSILGRGKHSLQRILERDAFKSKKSSKAYTNLQNTRDIIFKGFKGHLALQNSAKPGEVLLIHRATQEAKIFHIETKKILQEGLEVDVECSELEPGLSFHGGFLVSPSTTCFVDQSLNKVRLISKESPPQDHFSFVYLSEDEKNHYYLLGGRVYPNATHAYIALKIVPKKLSASYFIDFIENVPKFSGAMFNLNSSQEIYYTMPDEKSSNTLYKASVESLLSAAQKGVLTSFNEQFSSVSQPFGGLSFKLFINEHNYLFENNTELGSYESYLINRASQKKNLINIPKSCSVIGVVSKAWLVSCDQESLLLLP